MVTARRRAGRERDCGSEEAKEKENNDGLRGEIEELCI